jgi:hypothetical protein
MFLPLGSTVMLYFLPGMQDCCCSSHATVLEPLGVLLLHAEITVWRSCCSMQEMTHLALARMRRLCEPYITQTILEDTFGELAGEVAAKYLLEPEKGRFRLRDEYSRCAACLPVVGKR